MLDAYVEAGGNFIHTADVYAGGESEAMIGRYVAERGLRGSLVLATKSGFATGRGPHAGGNGAKHVQQAIDTSLRRLRTDIVDLYWLHVWDGVTPPEELLVTMAGLVQSGKIRYWGISNSPAWYVAKLATLAAVRGLPGPIALQYFYSLVNREVEDEHIPLAAEFGMGVVPWSPLAYGLLTGKYDRAVVEAAPARGAPLPKDKAADSDQRPDGDKRLDGANPVRRQPVHPTQLGHRGGGRSGGRRDRGAARARGVGLGDGPCRRGLDADGGEPGCSGGGQRQGARSATVARAPRRA